MRRDLKVQDQFRRVEELIVRHGDALAEFPGVVEVWGGFKFRNGRMTNTPAVIVSVLEKEPQSRVRAKEILPKKIDGVPIDVVPASAAQLAAFARVHGSATTQRRARALKGLVVQAAAVMAAKGAPMLPYVPAKPPPAPVNVKMKMTCHASPDAGWRVLEAFLGGTTKSLTATMYEFTADHIRAKLVSSLARSLSGK